jgi:hypothetical protein
MYFVIVIGRVTLAADLRCLWIAESYSTELSYPTLPSSVLLQTLFSGPLALGEEETFGQVYHHGTEIKPVNFMWSS